MRGGGADRRADGGGLGDAGPLRPRAAAVRRRLKRFSTYDLSDALELEMRVADLGDVPVQGLSPADGFAPIRNAVEDAVAGHGLTMLIGGNMR